ncbi:MAG: rhodanese-like domain-containing protein [Gemmatimonadales bacterium]
MTVRWWGLAALLAGATAAATRTAASQGKPPFTTAPYHAVRLADGVFVVPGDTGRGSEGRPNAGFVVTDSGVVVIDALASPLEARRFRDVIRTVTPAPVRWVVLTHHHPDHMMGTIVFTRDGARVIAHPDRTMQTRENGDEGLLADWDRIIGLHDLQGFAFADTPTWPITHDTTLVLGHTFITLYHPPGAAHTPGDLAIWLPATRVLFAGDLVVEDGVTMVVDGNSGILATALAHLDSLGAAIVVPGHGRADPDPRTELAATEHYIDSLRLAMRAAVRQGTPMTRILRQMPRPDSGRPVSLASRRQRNAERVYLEMERELMGMGSDSHGGGGPHLSGLAVTARLPAQFPAQLPQPRPTVRHILISTDSLASLLPKGRATIIDARFDVSLYLKSHIPGAAYINSESLRSMADGIPNLLLPAASYAGLFSRLGIRRDRPVVIYSAGETRDVDATYLSWILTGFGVASVAILDGGFSKWELESRPVTQRYPDAVAGSFTDGSFTPGRATLEDIRGYLQRRRGSAQTGAGATVLVDARPPDQYGGTAGVQMRHGHIPGAISHPWAMDMNEGLAHTFKSANEIRAGYAAQGITPDKDIIAYCNGGLESSHLYFALHDLLGFPHVRVYDGSWTEYAAHADLPVALGPAP